MALIGKGAKVDAEADDKKKTPLHYACERGLTDVAKALIGNGANAKAEAKD